MPTTRRNFLFVLAIMGLITQYGWTRSDDLAVVVHPGVPVAKLSDIELEAIFLTDRRFWSGTTPIIPFNLAPHSEPRAKFDFAVLRMDPDAVARFWRDRRVRGGAAPPRQAPDAGTLVRLVARLEGAIGYAPLDQVTGNVRVVARIHQGKLLPP